MRRRHIRLSDRVSEMPTLEERMVFNLFSNGTLVGRGECRTWIRGMSGYGRPRPR